MQPKVAIIAGTRLIFHFLAVYLLLCFPLLCRTVAQNLVVITLVGWFNWLVPLVGTTGGTTGGKSTGRMVPLAGTTGGGTGGPLVVITLDGEQLEAVVNMSSPPLLMGEM